MNHPSVIQRIAIVQIIAILAFFCTIGAQEIDPSTVFWPTNDSSWYSPGDPRDIDWVEKRYASALAQGDFITIFQGLAREFDSTKTDWSTNPAVKNKFRAELDSVIFELRAATHLKTDSVVDTIIASIKTIRFAKSSVWGVIAYFNGRLTQIELKPCDSGITSGCLTTEQAIDIRLRAKTIERLFNKCKASLRTHIQAAADSAQQAWDNYLFGSPFLVPWELPVNGLASRHSSLWSPPHNKWLIAHPELGMKLRGWKSKDLSAMTLDQILMIDFGWVRYLDNARTHCLGVAAVACFGGRNPIDLGATVRYDGVTFGATIPATGIHEAEQIALVGTIDLVGLVHILKSRADGLFIAKKTQKDSIDMKLANIKADR
jgi:hypothetical protein